MSVLGLAALSANHPIDDLPRLWGVTKEQTHRIRAYFHNNHPTKYVRELYTEFGDVFEGEPREILESHCDNPEELGIPLYVH